MAAKHQDYLGDGVYVEIEDGMIKLYLDNGRGPSDTIHLAPEVYDALTHYVARLKSLYADKLVPVSDIDQANMNLEEALAAIKGMISDINPIHLGQGKPVRVPGPGYAVHHVDGSAGNDPNNVSVVRVDENRRGS